MVSDLEMWQFSYNIRYKVNGIHYKYSWTPPYQRCICQLASKLGDLLSGGRRFNWIGMSLYETNPRGLFFYTKLKDFVLTGKSFTGSLQEHTSKEKYVI